ncbi:hypothetical protein OH77DRAFT_1449581 [Trametes cingulata]|nr:hypothetical protein OH77DRAFT_1449581 [Trametes cingulata]
MSSLTTIHAKERGAAPSVGEQGEETNILYLDVSIPPSDPLHTGQRVKVLSITSCDELFPSEEETTTRYYTARDIGVWGTVTRVRAEDEGVVEFVIENDNIRSATSHAYLAVPRREGLMIRSPGWRRWAEAALATLAKAARTIPIEANTVIFEDTTTLNFAAPAGVKRIICED